MHLNEGDIRVAEKYLEVRNEQGSQDRLIPIVRGDSCIQNRALSNFIIGIGKLLVTVGLLLQMEHHDEHPDLPHLKSQGNSYG